MADRQILKLQTCSTKNEREIFCAHKRWERSRAKSNCWRAVLEVLVVWKSKVQLIPVSWSKVQQAQVFKSRRAKEKKRTQSRRRVQIKSLQSKTLAQEARRLTSAWKHVLHLSSSCLLYSGIIESNPSSDKWVNKIAHFDFFLALFQEGWMKKSNQITNSSLYSTLMSMALFC